MAIGYRVPATRLFFDRAEVQRAVDPATRKVFSRFGAYVRNTARRSIRKRRKASSPGRPPSSHRGDLKRKIMFAYEPDRKTVVVGPEDLPAKKGETPETLEYGGWVKTTNTRRTKRRVGDAAEIRIGGRQSVSTKAMQDWQGRRRRVTYARLRTEEQARRANQLNEQLYGPTTLAGAVEPRPYMHPAYDSQKPALEGMWRDAITN